VNRREFRGREVRIITTEEIKREAEADIKRIMETAEIIETHHKRVRGGKLGGRPKDTTSNRDIEMAREYLRRAPTSRVKPTRLKELIGYDRDLGRNASIEAVDRGLRKLGHQGSKKASGKPR
jgi:hypothetical protein